MNELAKFTTDELLEELKARLAQSGLNLIVQTKAVEFNYTIGTVVDDSYGSYKVKLDQDFIKEHELTNEQLKVRLRPITGAFGSKSRPRLGDRVKIKCRITKSCPKFNMYQARIVEVIERCHV